MKKKRPLLNGFKPFRMYLLLLVGLISLPISAHDGKLWVNAAYRDTQFAGAGTAANPYLITSAEELAGLAYLVNEYSGQSYNSTGKYYKLTTNIDLSAHLWEPIGYFSTNTSQPTHYFNGHFDGDGFTISNMEVRGGSRTVDGLVINHGDGGRLDNYKGLFGYMGGSTTKTIKNLIIKNPIITDSGWGSSTWESGFVLGCCDGSSNVINIQNVHVDGGLLQAVCRSGGIVGLAHIGATVNMTHVSCSAEIDPYYIPSGGHTEAGGIIGSLSTSSGSGRVNLYSVVFCGVLRCNETVNSRCGGIVGYLAAAAGAGVKLHASPVVMIGEIITNNNTANSIGLFGGYLAEPVTRTGNYFATPTSSLSKWGNNASFAAGEVVDTQQQVYDKISTKNPFYMSGGRLYLYKPNNPQPTNFSAVVENGRVKLSWNMLAGNYLTPNAGYSIQARKYQSSDAWKDVNVKEGNLNYNASETSKTVYVEFPDLNETATQYEFRIKRRAEVWVESLTNYYPITTCTLPAYSYPKNLTLSSNPNEGVLTLTWNMNVQEASAPAGNYNLQWKNVAGEWVSVLPEEITTGDLNYNRTETTKSIILPYLLMDRGNYEFLFRLKRDDYAGYLAQSQGLTVNTNITEFTSISGEGNQEGIYVKWEQDNGRLDKNWYFRLYRKNTNESDFGWISGGFVREIKASELSTRSLFDNDAVSCTPYHYVIRLEEGPQGINSVVKATSPILKDESVVRLDSRVGEIESLSVSKGYYNDRVDINWVVTAGNSFTRYSITRKEHGIATATTQNIYEFNQSSAQTTNYRYTDESAIPGNYYVYEVIAWQDCNGVPSRAHSFESVGFMQPLGVVSGKVTYEGGNAVPGVSIIAENDPESQFANRSLIFNEELGTVAKIPYKDNMLSPDAFTVQFWVNDGKEYKAGGEDVEQPYFTSAYHYTLHRKNKALEFLTWDKAGNALTYSFNYAPPANNYRHITITYAASGNTGTAKLYVNGELTEELSNTYTGGVGFATGIAEMDTVMLGKGYEDDVFFSGYMDEFRMWNKVLDEETIASNYDAYLSGKEMNLAIYYRFDEPIANALFDISGRNGVFNENHASVSNTRGSGSSPERSGSVPKCDNKALTDANGNYIISTIPYSGEGSRIEIRPELGVHNFNPKNKPLYFNKQSNTYNNVDFVDISSFTLTGKVVYSGGTYPAEGCQFEIDGKTVVKNNGEVVKSAQDGTFIISVPIGVHEVRVVKQGHTFANDGLILDEAGENINYNSHITLQEPLLNTTLVKVIGRAVGGLTEYEKPLGFGESLNNLGIETVALTAKNSLGYKLSEIETEKTYYHNEGRWAKTVLVSEDTTTVVFEENAVTIKVSPHTGEFVAWLPPISYTVASVKAVGYGDQDLFSSTETLDLTNVAISDENYMQQSVRQWTDSVEADLRPGELPHKVAVEMSDSIAYHAKWEYYYQSVPTFTVKQLVDNEKVEYFGDKEYTFEDALTGESETIDLWTPENNYFFADPLFRQGNKYTFSLEAYERYENKATQVVYPYPVQGTVTMENTISVNGNESIELDESGEATYTFIAGAPKDGKNSFQGRVKIGSVSYHWDRGNNSVEAWHLGDQISGTDFMTSGPDEISAILRDPPGSLSYSYIEKGSTITSTTSYDVSNALKETQNITTSLGPKITTFVGFGVGVITENETKIDVSAGLSAEQTWSYSGETTTTTTFTERFQTSDDPLYVGSLGDVFIGNSTNIQYGLTEGVSIQKNYQGADALVTKNAYSIAPSVSVAYGQTFDTQFAYTQVELEEIMIPKWKDNLKNLLQPKGTNVTPSSLSYPVYVSNLDEDDENFGKLNTDTEAFGSLAVPANQFHDGPSYTIYFPTTNYDISEFREDSVMWFNNQINLWADVLAQNEKEKVEMKKLGNYSFGAGASIEWSKTETASKSYTSSFQWMLNPSIGLETGFEVFGIGVSTTTTVEYTHTSSDSETDTEETSITTGFVLQEEGDDDEITVDYGMTESGTIAFKTRGGRTSCPYEPAVISKYFEPGKHILSEGTAQIEVPRIGVEGSSSKLNVPANKTANFVLKMDNDSETGEDVWFQLIVEEKTNPYGAELKIDGGIIGNGRMFLVEAGKSLLKTVTVGKGTVDTYDINLILRSECQSDPTTFLPVIADTTNIYVEFVPSCSNVNIKSPANNWIANTATGDVLNIVLDGFERDYSNLGYIALEARNTASNTWDELMRFYTDETIYTKASGQKTLVPSTDANISYNWTMPAEDATYELRASAVCVNTNEEGVILSELSRYTTEVVRGVKDMKKPQPLGNPSPANGILNIGDEISILFNEEIRQGSVTENQISVSGVLNETVIAEPSVGLNFAATGCAYTEQPITVNGSFAIEGWFRRPSNSEGTLFAFGSDGNYISIGFDTANKPVLKLGENTYTSNNTISVSDEWKYLSMTYNRESERVSVTVLEGTSTTDLFEGENVMNAAQPVTKGRLYVGNMPDKSNAFNGAISSVHFWNTERSNFSDKNTLKTGKENGLIGYWLLDEGKGTVGTDKARSRHLTVETDWYIYPQGKSATLSGSDYLSINSTEFAFSKYDDFSIEFWFRGADQSNVTLLSVGHGINDIELSHKLSIAINANKELVLRSLGEENVITTNNVLTDQWHHLALTVKRGGTSNVYIDGTLTKQFGAEVIGSVGGDAYHFGASVYTRNDNGTMLPVTEDFFTGSLDDIRVWNSVLSSGVIELNMNNKLRGDEAGLLAYYPFEKGILPSAEDLVSGSLSADGFVSGENTPAIKNARSVEKVLFTYVTSNNKIVINLDDNYKQRVEGTTLEISVEDVYDMYDNKSDVQKWTVYVSRNPLMWMDDAIDLTIEEGTSETFTATIVNKSAEATDYIVENLPDWLTVNQPQGSLKPAATKDLTFTVSKGLNIGSYEAAVSLTGTSELSEKLPINLKVTGERPDWAVNQGDFSQYMSVYGNIQISGAPQEDKDDILAAFIGELCVGVANPIYIQSQNAYSVFMSVYGNDEHDGLNVTFKLWDASTGRIYPQVLTTQSGSGITVVFEGNETKYAKTNSPVIFNAEDVIEQQIALGAGWNWFSVNVKNDNPDLLTQFKDKIGANGTQIKAHNGNYLQPFVQGNSVTWAGTLTSLSVKETYLASLNEAQVLKMSGQPAKTTESDIVLNKGWNWVGYIPQLTTTVSHALSGFEAKSGDQIKSQSAFSIYDENNGWFGTLQYMQPGKGYMYYSENTNPVTFYYPNVTASLRSSEDLRSTQEETYWENDFRRFANNMTVTSIALLDDVIQESDQVEIAAFVGDDCRGTVLLSYQDIQGLSNNYLGFLMVYGESGDQIKFRMYDHTTGKEYIGLNEAVSFKANNSHGNLADPFELRFRSGTYLDDIEVNSVSIYPNPVETILNIKHNQDKIDRLEVADVSGRTVMTRIDFSEKTLNVSDLTDGLYLLKLTYNNETVVLKFNKK